MLRLTIGRTTESIPTSYARPYSLLIGLILFTTTNAFTQIALEASRTVSFDLAAISKKLQKAPAESLTESVSQPFTFSLPQPDGGERLFLVYDSPIMDADFQRQQPTFKTYKIVAADNPSVTGRMMTSQFGLNAIILSEHGTVGIRPKDVQNPILHEVYLGDGEADFTTKRLLQSPPSVICGFDEHRHISPTHIDPPKVEGLLGISNGTTRRTYRFAAVTTAEFYLKNGATVALAQAAVTNSVNSIQTMFDRDLAVRFTLLTPVVYTDTTSDPFIGDIQHLNPSNVPRTGDSRPNQAAEAVHMNFAVGNYDIGHVFHNNSGVSHWSGGGVAGLGVVCSSSTFFASGDADALTGYDKAAGWSGVSNSGGNNYNGWYRLFAHEVGHMFNMNHTFNGNSTPNTGNCGTGNLSFSTAYEIGSGTTIMSYNGLCDAAQNITSGGTVDNYFHVNSLESAVAFMGTISCQTSTSSGNTAPTATVSCAGPFSIPRSTPFTLTGSSTDANGDQVYYCWEQYDEDGAGANSTHGFIGATAAASSIAPLFRSYPPTTSPTRTFPDMSLVVANSYASSFEPLPTVDRTLNFKLTTRDYNTNGGGISTTEVAVSVSGAAFTVSAPNGGESLTAGNATTATWNVGGTAGYCSSVNIKLSIDGGLTYPYTLVSGTANDGTESVTIPSGVTNTSTARMRVESATNSCVQFFDISNADFSITSSCVAGSSNICSNAAVSFIAGNAGLNLGLTNAIGGAVTSYAASITSSDPTITIGTFNSTSTGCDAPGFSNKYKTFPFTVSATGSYTFSRTGSGTFPGFTVYNAATFNSSTPCTGFVSSNFRHNGGGSVTIFSSSTMTLNACNSYILLLTDLNASPTFSTTVNMTGAGSIWQNGASPGGSYGYTYVAVSNSDNLIKVVNASSNFTSLVVGTYTVYGISYNTSLTPSSWVGQTISQVLASGCVLFSTNSKPVTVTSVAPVELLSFSGKWQNNQSNLTWQTASEANSKGFDVERSLTGNGFEKIGFVKSQGNTNALQSYNFVDADFKPPPQYVYYRLKQWDNDGKSEYSKTIVLTPNGKAIFQLFPNPTSGDVVIQVNQDVDKEVKIELIDLLGRTILSQKQSSLSASRPIVQNLSTVSAGIYHLRITDGRQVLHVQRLVKQ